jgi:lipoprotein-anchoring transpeptidase ErfK/SrfK
MEATRRLPLRRTPRAAGWAGRARSAVRLGLLALVAAGLLLLGLLASGTAQDAARPAAPPARPAAATLPPGAATEATGPRPVSPRPAAAAHAARDRRVPPQLVLRVRDSVTLLREPGGVAATTVGAATEFGSPRTLTVARRHGRWLAVSVPELPNGQLGWLDARSAAVERSRSRLSLHADLSERRVELRRGERVLMRVSVAIGGPQSPTPVGRFSVTDRLPGPRFSPTYGCCILALSGHQTNLPPGWSGGDRLAIHGTNDPASVGTPASAGCLRAENDAMQRLYARVPLGTPVQIRR